MGREEVEGCEESVQARGVEKGTAGEGKARVRGARAQEKVEKWGQGRAQGGGADPPGRQEEGHRKGGRIRRDEQGGV